MASRFSTGGRPNFFLTISPEEVIWIRDSADAADIRLMALICANWPGALVPWYLLESSISDARLLKELD